MDANRKSDIWHSPVSDSRGTKLCKFFSINHLFVINEDSGPTFCISLDSIDVTAVGTDVLGDVSCWNISDYESFSDYLTIEFEFTLF